MGLNWRQFELGILRPTLEKEPEVAIKLVGETIWHEGDRLRALGQYPHDPDAVFGPGLGPPSIERPTWDWMLSLPLKEKFGRALAGRKYEELAWDLRLGVLACRFRYKVDKRPLPVLEDGVAARAEYWFKVYNGSGVASRRDAYVDNALDIEWVK